MSECDSVAVAKVLRGEGDAYRILVERHGRFLFRVACRITGNVSDAGDVVQEAFLRAFRSLHLYDSRATFSTWMHRIEANCALDMVRKRNRRMETVVADTGDDDVKRDILAQMPAKDPGTHRIVYSSQVRDHRKLAMEDLSPLQDGARRRNSGQDVSRIVRHEKLINLRLECTKNTIPSPTSIVFEGRGPEFPDAEFPEFPTKHLK